MDKKRDIPYGVMNWATLVHECLFVDNTAYIRTLENVRTPVFLRPKRFGKSMVCSMLAHYYDVNLKDRFDEFFGKTDIGRNPTPLRNSFLVLQFDFSTVQVGTLAQIEERFWKNVQGAVGYLTVKYKDLADWSDVKSATAPAECIDKVRDVIRANNLPPLYVIIDEYNSSEGRCDFLAVPKPGSPKPALIVEFKYFTNEAAEKGNLLGRKKPDAETVKQALDYRTALARRPDWDHPIDVTVIEVCGNTGYNWFDLSQS